ncbi:MAG: ABC transporter permease [Victivallales bacterium]|nr:ABC transporter permease [Victivallales bacterium]
MASVPTTTIKASRGFGSLGLAELWEYRDLLRFQILREVKGKYRQMALGPLWIVLQPVINMVVLSFVFGKVAKLDSGGVPYPILTYTALVPWTFFANACTFTSGCLVTEMRVISKVYFPRLVIPLASVIARLVDFTICFGILVVMMCCMGYWPTLRWLLLPGYVLLAVSAALALGLWSASIAVRFRDVLLVVRYGIQTAMYITPVAYAAQAIPEKWLWLLQLNPMFWVIEGFRWCLIGTGAAFEAYALVSIFGTAVLLVTGAFVFRRTERTIVDLL